eukprot:gnl/MRDRNA2_/MRDRNA2_93818_c0_seq1.p1 gnl/MRDRNA2_/MRDRNA2_93818_c0~~gnl/MRDRNA2_/MRDRNA2_93818_c0_seq1.p1  ORF type:complete len:337 (+),score=103.84 gnl/MRDRNA2_/MRDRNA2_93818_c0_seq1:141-1151(+)
MGVSSLSDSSSSSGSNGKKKKKKESKKKAKKKEKKQRELAKLEQQERIREQKAKGVRRTKLMNAAATNPFETPTAVIPPPPPGCSRVDFGFLDRHLGLDLELNGNHASKGVVVRSVQTNSVAMRKGITRKSVIKALNGESLPDDTKELEEALKKRPLVVDFVPAESKGDKKEKKDKKKLEKALEAEAKRRAELKSQDADSQTGPKESSPVPARESRLEAKRSCPEDANSGTVQNGSSEQLNGASSKADEISDSSEKFKEKKSKKSKSSYSDKDLRRLAHDLMEADPGSPPCNEALSLKLLTKQQSVAWQWRNNKGVMQYPIPIGSNKPLSPFSDTD